ncbi:hypothetical protein [Streptomyces sp. 1222.5]|uniref:hypothetical protein n=1 Tax=Streptomyces sp. 1222.5 TaxID=1881026 RepID=UPI003EBF4096
MSNTLEIEQVRRLGLTSVAAPKRLVEPLAPARECVHWTPGTGHQRRFARDAAGLVVIRCGELGRSFWGWSDEDWADLINRSGAEFRRLWGGQIGPNARPFLIAFAYLLGGFTAFEQVGRFQRPTLAQRVFGQAAVDDAVGKIIAILGDWGYERGPDRTGCSPGNEATRSHGSGSAASAGSTTACPPPAAPARS